MLIRNRVKELRLVPGSQLRPSPRNWRRHPAHQRDALRGLLAEVGIADAVIARELPDGSLELCDGHLRAEELPDTPIPVLVLDVDEAEADKLLATLDPLAGMAGIDEEALRDLLARVSSGDAAVVGLLDELRTVSPVVMSAAAPTDFPVYDEGIKTEFACPKCGYEWSGDPAAGLPMDKG